MLKIFSTSINTHKETSDRGLSHNFIGPLPPGVYPLAVNKHYIILYYIILYYIILYYIILYYIILFANRLTGLKTRW